MLYLLHPKNIGYVAYSFSIFSLGHECLCSVCFYCHNCMLQCLSHGAGGWKFIEEPVGTVEIPADNISNTLSPQCRHAFKDVQMSESSRSMKQSRASSDGSRTSSRRKKSKEPGANKLFPLRRSSLALAIVLCSIRSAA